MTKVYFDNAATTRPLPEVLNRMQEILLEYWGNPSSIHAYGRKAKIELEQSRRSIAKLLGIQPSEIIFTSGATEAINHVFYLAVEKEGVERIILSPIEHKAVLEAASFYAEQKGVLCEFLPIDKQGNFRLEDVEKALKNKGKALLASMSVHNELGNIYPITDLQLLARQYKALFFSDMVQAFPYLTPTFAKEDIKPDYFCASAHKFHGPKGVGFLYIRESLQTNSLIRGGGQEFGRRGGTENLAGIVGMAEAMNLAYQNATFRRERIRDLKKLCIEMLQKDKRIRFNGFSADLEKSSPHILHLSLDSDKETSEVLLKLDMAGISVSAGSACSSGSHKDSHVVKHIKESGEKSVELRLSFSFENNREEVFYLADNILNL